jgi:glyoxylase-like metal-dependent hydrolase (beta-lactamase superfamily II)
MRHYTILAAAAALLATPLAPFSSPAYAQEQEMRAIEAVSDGLYRWTSGTYHSVFLVHAGGIVVGDPLNREAAAWLKSELARRFPDKPITHVIYSHNHSDHAYGGEVLDGPGVWFIAHELARADLVRTKARARIPDTVFSDRMTLNLGEGQTIDLAYHGSNNGRGSISMLFGPQKVLHVVDWIVLGRLPYRKLQGYDLAGMIESTHAALDMDFATFVGGHADIGDKSDVRRYLSYIEALHDGVRDGILAGRSLDRIRQDLTLAEFSDLKQFDAWRTENIEGAYHTLVDDHYLTMRPEVPETPPQ